MTSKTLDDILYISRCYNSYQRILSGRTELVPSHLMLISYICGKPGARQDSLTETLGIDKTRLTHRLNDLEKQGYIVRKVCEEDARARRIYPTQKAETVYPEIREHFEQFGNEAFANFSDGDYAALEQLIAKVRLNAKETMKRFK